MIGAIGFQPKFAQHGRRFDPRRPYAQVGWIALAKPDGYTIGSGQVGGGMPEEFDKFIQDERAKWAEVIKEVNISVEK